MKPNLFIAVTLLAAFLAVGCNDNSTGLSAVDTHRTDVAALDLGDLAETLADMEIQELTDEEIAGLMFMREEEKLARDVYLTFQGQYDVNIFANIATSEQVHTDAVLMLLDRYGLEDPVGDSPLGDFQDEVLQKLFDDLVAEGSESLAAALYVGCAIEEIDILDLVQYMADTEYADLLLVYGKLLDGSGNHIRAFVRLWEQETGEQYVPRFMSAEDYEAIISAGDTGGQRGGRNGRGRGGRR